MEWKEVTLGDFMQCNPKRTIKKGQKARKITMDLLIPHSKTIRNWNYEPYSGGAKFQNGDTIMARITPCLENGKHAFVSILNKGEIAYGSTEYFVFCGKEDVSDNDFVYYLTKTPLFRDTAIKSMVGSSGRQRAQMDVLENLKMLVPKDISDQRRIASILSSLDRKIELNNKINADLEEMAQAIFKNWFVDFEPFKDGKFVDSELGMIPEGWKVVTLDDLTSKFGTGLNPRKNFVLGHGNNYYVTIKNMGNNRIYLNDRCDKVDDEALAKINKRSKLQKGDLLFSGIGTIGRVAMIVDDPINWNTSESVFNMHPIDTVSSEFIYLLLLSDKFQQYVQQNAQGGGQQGIRMASLKAFQFAIPDDLNLFDNLVKPIISKVKSNDKENDTLSLLRDTLLPRLMSGEIEVPE